MMNREIDIMVAYPPWRLEYIEKKRKREAKLPVNEVPQWKRELLKRIQSKNLRMIEEQQVDILEEHIPKVSDNIFVTHQKKPQRLPSAPSLRTISNESLVTTTPTYSIAVDNIIIIEKDDKGETTKVEEKVPSSDETKEYPTAGIVHRLLGRFQTDEFDKQAKKSSQTYIPYQKTQRPFDISENYQASRVETPTPSANPIFSVKEVVSTPTTAALTADQTYLVKEESPSLKDTVTSNQISPVKEAPSLQPAISIEESEPLSEPAMQSDMLSPLLISSAKPFTRQRADNPDRFHHVNKPIRKVTAPVSTKNSVPKSETKTMIPVDPIPCPPQFADDLSHLHANAQKNEKSATKETILIQKDTLPKIETAPPIPKRVDLKNGETLHSSGSESAKKSDAHGNRPPVPIKRFDPYASLHDKSNSRSRQLPPKVETKEAAKPNSIVAPKVVTSHNLQPEVTVKEPTKQIETSTSVQTAFQENRLRSEARRKDQVENGFKKVVHESLDETTLKTSAAKAANRIMQTSKTFKITPSKQSHRNTASYQTDTSSRINNTYSIHNNAAAKSDPLTASVKSPKIPLRRHEMDTPSVSVSMNKPEPTVTTKTQRPVTNSTDGTVNSFVVKPPVLKNVPNQIQVTPPVSQPVAQAQAKTLPTINSTAKSPVINSTAKSPMINSAAKSPVKVQSESKPSIFGPRITKSSSSTNRGKSFTIDPSKFRRSSAQPLAASPTSSSSQDGTSTRTIVPGAKSQTNANSEFGGDQPKSGKRKITVDQITVIGGYVTMEKSCLIKDTKRKKKVSISFCEKDLETIYSYVSERSLLEEDQPSVEFKKASKSPGFGKDSTIGKYTPKYLLSLTSSEILDNEEDISESKSVKESSGNTTTSTTTHAMPLSDENAIAWSDTTSGATDILF